jgi:ATP-dependent RNA helicase DHX37/DHR1
MEEIHKLRAQISNIVAAHFPSADVGYAAKLKPPNDLQVERSFSDMSSSDN